MYQGQFLVRTMVLYPFLLLQKQSTAAAGGTGPSNRHAGLPIWTD
jgi:hypothetical protein